jgi:hypothetical protein
MSKFIAMCVAGDAMPEDIDEFVGKWHEGDSEVPIYEYLGMTRDEYLSWVSDPNALSAPGRRLGDRGDPGY